jgi:hypothetical protein
MTQESPTYLDLVDQPKPAEAPPAPVTPVARAVATIMSIKDAALARFTQTEADLTALAERYRGVAFDVSTTKGLGEAKAARYDLRENGRFAVQRIRDAVKDEINGLKSDVTAKADVLIAITKPTEDAIDAQITKREQEIEAEKKRKADEEAERQRLAAEAEAARTAAHRANIDTIKGYPAQAAGQTSARIVAAHDILRAQLEAFLPEQWEEFADEARTQLQASADKLQALADQARHAEAEAAHLEEQRIAQEAMQRRLDEQAAQLAEAQAKIDQANREREQREAQAAADAQQGEQAANKTTVQPAMSGGQVDGSRAAERHPGVCSGHTQRDQTSPPAPPPAEPVARKPMVTVMVPDAVTVNGVTTKPGVYVDSRVLDDKPDTEPDTLPTLKLGDLCARFGMGFVMTAEFLAGLGGEGEGFDFHTNPALRGAKLYHAEDFPLICSALIDLIADVRDRFTS